MAVLAIDKGTTFTKTSEALCFKSTIREYMDGEVDFGTKNLLVEHNNKKYVIGENGKTNTNLFKSQHEETKLIVLTAIALSNPSEVRTRIDLITGLPIGRYGYEKENMKKLFQFTNSEITVNHTKYRIEIARAEVFPEGASSFYMLDQQEECLVIDIGGLSVDIALFSDNKKLVSYATYQLGTMRLYRQIANYLGSKYSLTLNEWDVEDILKKGLFIDGRKVELEIDHTISEHLREIVQTLEFEFNLSTINNIYLTGGGGQFLYPYFKKRISRARLMDNSQFTTVLAYKKLGEVLFGEKSQRF